MHVVTDADADLEQNQPSEALSIEMHSHLAWNLLIFEMYVSFSSSKNFRKSANICQSYV